MSGFTNLAIDSSFVVRGLFDYRDAAWADRHLDFRYLSLGSENSTLLDAALAAYERAVGLALRRDRIELYNAACAISFLASRRGKGPDEP